MKFEFTEKDYNRIVKEAMLNDELSKIFLMKIKGYSIIQISMEIPLSVRTTNRRIKELKKKISKVI